MDQSDSEEAKKTDETCEDVSDFTYFYKTQPEQKTSGNFPNVSERIDSPDIWVSRFGCWFSRNSGRETIVITIVRT